MLPILWQQSEEGIHEGVMVGCKIFGHIVYTVTNRNLWRTITAIYEHMYVLQLFSFLFLQSAIFFPFFSLSWGSLHRVMSGFGIFRHKSDVSNTAGSDFADRD